MHGKSDAQIKLSDLQSPQWEGIYLAPTHPEVNPYLLSVFLEVAKKYDVDGIHLDYIRLQNEIYGYNKEGMKEFDNIYNVNPRDIVRGIISTRFGWSQDFVDSMYIAWDQYRMNAVSGLVKETYERIKLIDENIDLTAAVKPNLLDAKNRWFQEWNKWIDEGFIDYVVPMNYFKEISDFNNSIQIMKSYISTEDLDKIIIGIATYNQDAQSAADKVLLTRLNGFQGVSVFSWDSHKENPEWFNPVNDALKSLNDK